MMKYVSLPDNQNHPLPFYLTMEEWLARNFTDDFFFTWQVDPTVICGRNQIVDLEVDIDYCRNNDISICRRKSGGGCVFADRKNIMFSYITTSASVMTEFSAYTSMIASMLRNIGLDASASTRNDVLIGDRKVSGNAFYHIPEKSRAIVHGTMLYDIDSEKMNRAITPSRAKLESKGVKSVASRITTISEHSSIGLEEFKDFARKSLCGDSEMTLSAGDVEQIYQLARELMSDKWVFRKTSGQALVRTGRIDGSGEFRAEIELDSGKISSINLSGDYFPLADIDTSLLDSLKNTPYNAGEIERALTDIDISKIISGITNEEFITLII
ncbi:MAG: lipoyltransferase [Paramuribaculum sp.]|nr:lipoyltransferase [Paramuribaculum sp.]